MGLLSPVAIYALDFWEHSIGLALMLWGVYWLLRAGEASAGVRTMAISGAFFGAAACMRTEALVYLVVCGGVILLAWLWRTRALAATAGRGLALLAGAAVPLLLNTGLERLVLGGTFRTSRAADTGLAFST